MRFLSVLLWCVAATQLYATDSSVSLLNTTGNAIVPNTAPYTGMGSYWFDFRITSWSIPGTGCQWIVQLPAGGNSSNQIRICQSSTGWVPFIIFTGSDQTLGGIPLSVGPPHIGISAATGTNPMVLTLASTPFPSAMAVGSIITIGGVQGTGCSGMNANQTITAVSGNAVTIAYDGTGCTYTSNTASAYSQDFVFRYHRDLQLNQAIGESWNVDGSGYSEAVQPLIATPAMVFPGVVTFGQANAQLSYLRWYGGTIPAGSKAPWGNSANAGGVVLADWEFDGNANDSSGGHLDLTFSPAATYFASAVYAPSCNQGLPQTWRAGAIAQLDASRSFPMDGSNGLSYVWQAVPSAEAGARTQYLRWSSHTAVNPTISGFEAGPVNVQLTVTDQSGQSSSCIVHNGAVATDDQGNVLVSNPQISSILGPLTQWGSSNSRWPWFDIVEKQWADSLGGNQGTVQVGRSVSTYLDNWNVPLAGTVTATFGSVRLTGVGTTFQSTFCHGNHFSNFSGEFMIIPWYPFSRMVGGTGRRSLQVGKCVSDTVLDLGQQYSDDDGSSSTAYNLDAPPGFAYTNGSTLLWRPSRACAGGPTTLNVNGLGAVALKKADGVTDPAAADCAANTNVNNGINLRYNGSVFTLQGTYTAPIYWTNGTWSSLPGVTAGMQYSIWTQSDLGSWIGGSTNINYYDNVLAFYVMYYRTGIDTYLHYARWLADRWWTMPYHDQGNVSDGQYGGAGLTARSESFTGLILRALDQDGAVPGSSPMWAGLREEIDMGYRSQMNNQSNVNWVIGDLRETAYNAMWVALCAAYDPDATHAALCRSDLNKAILTTWKGQRQPDGSWQALQGSYSNIVSSFAILNGASGTVTVTPGSNVVTMAGGTWSSSWFPAEFFSVGNGLDYTTRDNGYYNATYVDSTHIQLDRPYTDACGSKCAGRSWVISTGGPGSGWVGFGVQPFMLGITAQFFNQASIALNMDPQYAATAALAKSYVVDVANWMTTTATYTASRGLYYGVGFGVCVQPNPAASCYSNTLSTDYEGSRELSPEVLGGIAMGYAAAPTPALQTGIDNLFSAVYAKNPTDPGYDGLYAKAMDPLSGGFFWGNPKWHGFFWGMGRNAVWLNARQGGLAAPNYVSSYINGNLAAIPGATQIKVTVTDPSGVAAAPVLCSSFPCAVSVNQTIGNPLAQVSYTSANGVTLATSDPFILTVK